MKSASVCASASRIAYDGLDTICSAFRSPHLNSSKVVSDDISYRAAYRPDIDGLRAVAVIAVVGYHAYPTLVTGGFVGVDVFFVISGFLIGTIIYSGLERNDFSLRTFYVRRAKRILPALIVVCCAVLAIGYVVLISSEFKDLGESVVAASLFSSNILLWVQTGYFDTAANNKELLHLWSLGVEEQFYLIWPLLAIFMWRRMDLLVLTLMVGVISFATGLYLTYADPVSAFYLPVSRFWELMLGCGLARWNMRAADNVISYRNLRSSIGIAAIILSVALLSTDDHFPGWLALLPTVGTLLLLSAGPDAAFNKIVLSHKSVVWIGLISYPLYLWHWPLLSFLRVMEGGDLPAPGATLTVVLALFLAYLTYEFVEKKIRHLRLWTVAPALCSLLAAVGLSGLAIRQYDGVPARAINRLNVSDNWVGDVTTELVNECGMSPSEQRGIAFCVEDRRGRPVYALLGDSKAAALFPGLVKESEKNERWMFIGGADASGAPIPVISDAAQYRASERMTVAAAKALARNPSIRVVVLATAIRSLFQTTDPYLADLPETANSEIVFNGLDKMVAEMTAAGKEVVLAMDNPTLADPAACISRLTHFGVINRLFQHQMNRHCSISVSGNIRRTKVYRDLIERLSLKWGDRLKVFDPTSVMCLMEQNICPIENNGHLLYSYGDHISDYASLLMARQLIPIVHRLRYAEGS
jgi:peptidoglycan/LPS O-acetylase OafA/YrhL